MGPSVVPALTQAVKLTPLEHLHSFSADMDRSRFDGGAPSDANHPIKADANMAELVRALAFRCPALSDLHLRQSGMGQEAGEVLLQALAKDAWPYLQWL